MPGDAASDFGPDVPAIDTPDVAADAGGMGMTGVAVDGGGTEMTDLEASVQDLEASTDGGFSTDTSASDGSGGLPEAAPRTWTVLVGANGLHAFSPPALVISVGDTVHWVWQASGHTVTSGTGRIADGRFCSPTDTQCSTAPTGNAGDTYDHTFASAGQFPYFCMQHDMMLGSITVQ